MKKESASSQQYESWRTIELASEAHTRLQASVKTNVKD